MLEFLHHNICNFSPVLFSAQISHQQKRYFRILQQKHAILGFYTKTHKIGILKPKTRYSGILHSIW